jgi:hypothetical protein
MDIDDVSNGARRHLGLVDGPRVGEWVATQTGGQFRSDAVAIGLEKGNAIVAGAIFDSFNGASVVAHVAATHINREWLHMIHFYPFQQLKVNCVLGIVSSDNEAALRFDKHLGFREVTRIPGACPTGDMVLLVMNKEDRRYGKAIGTGSA